MKRILAMIPAGHQVGLTTASLGLVRALMGLGYRTGFFKPISQPDSTSSSGLDRSSLILERYCSIISPHPIHLEEAEALLRKGDDQSLMERVAELFNHASRDVDVMVVEGMVSAHNVFFSKRLNNLIIETLDAEVILVSSAKDISPTELAEAIEIQAREYCNDAENAVIGCVVNKIGQPNPTGSKLFLPPTSALQQGIQVEPEQVSRLVDSYKEKIEKSNMTVLASIPFKGSFTSPRLKDLVRAMDAHPIHTGMWEDRIVKSITLAGQSLEKVLPELKEGALLVCSADREEILLAAALAEIKNVNLAGILLAGTLEPGPNVMAMIGPALGRGLPLIAIAKDLYSVSAILADVRPEIPMDDKETTMNQMESVASEFDSHWLKTLLDKKREHRTSPAAFRNFLLKLAREQNKRIVLPEGDEPRTIEAAIICYEKGMATPILLAKTDEVKRIAAERGLTLPPGVEIIDPESLIDGLVGPMVELRKSKGLTEEKAREMLSDPIYVGTMMLKLGQADGLVSGAVHTSANTVKPALQLIKCLPGVDTVSSIFFMCLPNQVMVYGDCAIVQDPTAEQLASIAIQSADSAKAFNIPQRVAMVSYSTGESGTGADVEKVRQATRMVREKRPDICIDGPLQYDAAVNQSVADKKAPDSSVAGKATAIIFPDLNTGNTTYKAVQRSAHVVSIGPMLQGLKKPVNDLSRGALVDDIIYTIALTAIQAGQTENAEERPAESVQVS